MNPLVWFLVCAGYFIVAGCFYEAWKYEHYLHPFRNFDGFFFALFWPISACCCLGRWLFRLVF